MKIIHAAVGIILNAKQQILVDRRPMHWEKGGYWEFPGGKVEPHETVQQALVRELQEEIGILVQQSQPFFKVQLQFPHKQLILDAWQVTDFDGEVQSLEGQEVRWIAISELKTLAMLESNRQILDKIYQSFLS